MSSRSNSGFTLIELLLVLGLVAILAGLALPAVSGGGTTALHSGQAVLANLVTAARARAVTTNRDVRLLFRNSAEREDYRRRIVMVEEQASGWVALEDVLLPVGVAVLPYRTRWLPGAQLEPAAWRTADGSAALGSTALQRTPVEFSYDAGVEVWEYVGFKPQATLETGAGALVLALVDPRAPGIIAPGHSPIVFGSPDAVLGLQLSNYGVPRPVYDRNGF